MWRGVMKRYQLLKNGLECEVGDGRSSARFCLDILAWEILWDRKYC